MVVEKMAGLRGNNMELVYLFIQRIKDKGFDSLANKMTVTSATDKILKTEFKVTEEMTNMFGTLHGGASATIADIVSTLGLLVRDQNRPGVSVNLSMNYLKAAQVGELIVVESEILRVGKTLAYLNIKLIKKDTGELVATGSHVKHVGS